MTANTADRRLSNAVDELIQARQAVYRAYDDLQKVTQGMDVRELPDDVVAALAELPELQDRVGDHAQNLKGVSL
jgi:anion-transporting  ArsA/GET3 family ATPase